MFRQIEDQLRYWGFMARKLAGAALAFWVLNPQFDAAVIALLSA